MKEILLMCSGLDREVLFGQAKGLGLEDVTDLQVLLNDVRPHYETVQLIEAEAAVLAPPRNGRGVSVLRALDSAALERCAPCMAVPLEAAFAYLRGPFADKVTKFVLVADYNERYGRHVYLLRQDTNGVVRVVRVAHAILWAMLCEPEARFVIAKKPEEQLAREEALLLTERLAREQVLDKLVVEAQKHGLGYE